MRTSRSHRSGGIALLIVLVVLVLIATLATEITITAKTHHQLGEHAMEDLLLRSAVDGRVPILKAALKYDLSMNTGFDGEADEWSWHANHANKKLSSWGERASAASTNTVNGEEAKTVAAYNNTDVQLTAWCEDEHAKLNLRGLQDPEAAEHVKATLIRLIDVYRADWSSLDCSDNDGKEMVDDLMKWLNPEADTDDNPKPAVKDKRGRLQSIDDLLRVPGGRWTPERLYDVKDPDATEDDTTAPTDDASNGVGRDPTWERQNGVPGLIHYLSVWAEDTPKPSVKINVNTASLTMLKALFDSNDEDLATKIVETRRKAADDQTGAAPATGTTTGAAADQTLGFFKGKAEIPTKVEGMAKDLKQYKEFDFFADVASNIYSLRIIARMPKKGANADAGATASEDEKAPKQIDAVYDFHQVVQRTTTGFITLYTERRSDPLFDQ
jgi:hypothetical protein